MIRDDFKEIKTDDGRLRPFGLLVGGLLMVLGVIWCARGKPYCFWPMIPGAALVVSALAWPRALKRIYVAWMFAAVLMGHVVSTLILTLFFFLVITPIGLAARIAGKDFLTLKLDRKAGSYWIRGPKSVTPRDEYERQF